MYIYNMLLANIVLTLLYPLLTFISDSLTLQGWKGLVCIQMYATINICRNIKLNVPTFIDSIDVI